MSRGSEVRGRVGDELGPNREGPLPPRYRKCYFKCDGRPSDSKE